MPETALVREEKRDEAGRFVVPPVSPGRPKGARSKLGEDFLKALQEDFTANGVAVIAKVREDKPDQYLKVVASILPKEFEASDETINLLTELLARVDGRTRNITPVPLLQETAH
jgi:hypothetical protein